MTTEEKTATTILQSKIAVVIGGETFNVPQPNTATLIRASALISKLPQVSPSRLKAEEYVLNTLAVAKDCRPIIKIIALFICGVPKIWNIFKLIKLWYIEYLIKYSDISKVKEAFIKILSSKQIEDFFVLITSLNEVNILRETREVMNSTATASGQS